MVPPVGCVDARRRLVLIFAVILSVHDARANQLGRLGNTLKLFPFGIQNGDKQMPVSDDGTVQVNLDDPVRIFGAEYKEVTVNQNGGLSFGDGGGGLGFLQPCAATSVPIIAPFWTDTYGGAVYYRDKDAGLDLDLRLRVTTDVLKKFGVVFLPRRLFFATWFDVTYFGACTQSRPTNTFQVVLATNLQRSYVYMLYQNVTWTGGAIQGAACATGLGGTAAEAALDQGDGSRIHQLPSSCTADMVNIEQTSNTGTDGEWMFRVDNPLPLSVQ